MTRRLRLVVSGACALLAVLLCALYAQRVREEAERVRSEALERYGGEVVSLVVAPEGLEAGEVVDRGNAVERDWLADLAPADAVTSLDEVLGAEVTVPAAAGAPLTALNFRTSGDALEVPSGRVALSVPVTDDLGLPSVVAAGTELVAYEVSDSGVSVVAVDVQVLRPPAEQSSLGTRGSVALAVAPEDVARVLASSAEGSLRLALPADDVSGLDANERGVTSAPTEVLAEPVEGDAAPDSPEESSEGGDAS